VTSDELTRVVRLAGFAVLVLLSLGVAGYAVVAKDAEAAKEVLLRVAKGAKAAKE
jgi:hypothetical protein